MCRLCIFNSVAGGTDFYGRLEKETYLSEKPMPVSHNRNGYWEMPLNLLLLAPEGESPEKKKKKDSSTFFLPPL